MYLFCTMISQNAFGQTPSWTIHPLLLNYVHRFFSISSPCGLAKCIWGNNKNLRSFGEIKKILGIFPRFSLKTRKEKKRKSPPILWKGKSKVHKLRSSYFMHRVADMLSLLKSATLNSTWKTNTTLIWRNAKLFEPTCAYLLT